MANLPRGADRRPTEYWLYTSGVVFKQIVERYFGLHHAPIATELPYQIKICIQAVQAVFFCLAAMQDYGRQVQFGRD